MTLRWLFPGFDNNLGLLFCIVGSLAIGITAGSVSLPIAIAVGGLVTLSCDAAYRLSNRARKGGIYFFAPVWVLGAMAALMGGVVAVFLALRGSQEAEILEHVNAQRNETSKRLNKPKLPHDEETSSQFSSFATELAARLDNRTHNCDRQRAVGEEHARQHRSLMALVCSDERSGFHATQSEAIDRDLKKAAEAIARCEYTLNEVLCVRREEPSD